MNTLPLNPNANKVYRRRNNAHLLLQCALLNILRLSTPIKKVIIY